MKSADNVRMKTDCETSPVGVASVFTAHFWCSLRIQATIQNGTELSCFQRVLFCSSYSYVGTPFELFNTHTQRKRKRKRKRKRRRRRARHRSPPTIPLPLPPPSADHPRGKPAQGSRRGGGNITEFHLMEQYPSESDGAIPSQLSP